MALRTNPFLQNVGTLTVDFRNPFRVEVLETCALLAGILVQVSEKVEVPIFLHDGPRVYEAAKGIKIASP